jgi:hypothetical protein
MMSAGAPPFPEVGKKDNITNLSIIFSKHKAA